MPQQAIERGETIETVAVERHDDRQRIVGLESGIGDQMQAGADLAQQEMHFLGRDLYLAGEEGAQRGASRTRGNGSAGQAQDRGVGRLAPEHRLVMGRQAWPGREIATPSGAPSVRAAVWSRRSSRRSAR
jgi:hypothetical protein